MAKNGDELEMKDFTAIGGKNLSSPKGQRPNYESLKEVNDDNGKQIGSTCFLMTRTLYQLCIHFKLQ